jgi:amino acid transporter
VAVGLIAVFSVVNYLGARTGAVVQNVLTLIKFAAIVGVSVLVFAFADGAARNFLSPAPAGFSGGLLGNFGLALVASLWAYKGWEATTFAAGEIRQPERNLPLGLFVGTLLVIVLYLAANLAYLYVFPASAIASSDRIAADAMQAAIGPLGGSIIAAAILCSIAGATNGNLLTSPRVFYASGCSSPPWRASMRET